jgi:Zn-dependent metalloprotease
VIERVLRSSNGRLQFLSGQLGELGHHDNNVLQYVHSLHELLELSGSERFRITRQEIDAAGHTHVHLQQYIGDIEVDGGEVAVHYDRQHRVFALSISVLAADAAASYMQPAHVDVTTVAARQQLIRSTAPISDDFEFVHDPEVVYLVHDDYGHAAVRAWVRYTNAHVANLPVKSAWYSSVHSAKHIVEFPLYFHALNRTIFTANHTDTLPGQVVRTEGQSATNDAAVNAAYDNAGVCYRFYKEKFNRDSYDGKGGDMISTVHYDVDYNNAFWNGEQMVYGDGDGVRFTNMAMDLTVVCHELTHAVVQYSAGLRYWKESGALNEAFADMMGASADIFNHTACMFEQQWTIGYTCCSNGGMRYLNNPTQDGRSYDYYPERYMGFGDNGGVHTNSGIANLAYVLTVQGGVHPRQKTRFWVQGLGLAKAEQVFYSALTNYMLRTTDFLGTRFATELAAEKLYSSTEARTLSNAWAAVGVGAPPKASPPPPPPAPKPQFKKQ